MSERAGTDDKSVELESLPVEECLTQEEKEELAGAGRFRPTFEALKMREMMDADLGGALAAPMAPTDGGGFEPVGLSS